MQSKVQGFEILCVVNPSCGNIPFSPRHWDCHPRNRLCSSPKPRAFSPFYQGLFNTRTIHVACNYDCTIHTISFRPGVRNPISAKNTVSGEGQIRRDDMLWDDSVDVDCNLDSVAYLPRTRPLLRIACMVYLKIRGGRTYNFVDNWGITLDKRNHNLHQAVHSQYDRPASTDCCLADGLLPCPRDSILEFRNTILCLSNDRAWRHQIGDDGYSRSEFIRIDEWSSPSLPQIKHSYDIIWTKEWTALGSRQTPDPYLGTERVGFRHPLG